MKRKKLLRICAVLSMILCFELVFVLVVRGQGIGGAYRKNLNLGHQYILDEDYENAVKAFSEAIKANPKSEAYIGLGDAYLGLGEYEKAWESFEDAQKLDETLDLLNDKFGVTKLTILDQDGSPVSDALVELSKESASGEAISLKTDGQGNAEEIICPGDYTIKVTKDRYLSIEEKLEVKYRENNLEPFEINSIDRQWVRVNEEQYNSQGELTAITSYNYDDYGNVILRNEEDLMSVNNSSHIYQYNYDNVNRTEPPYGTAFYNREFSEIKDAEGNVEIRVFDEGGSSEKWSVESIYANGRMIEKSLFRNEEIWAKESFTYEKGRLTGIRYSDINRQKSHGSSEFEYISTYSYNKDGLVKEIETEYVETERLYDKKIYEYDEKGRVRTEEHYHEHPDEGYIHNVFTYNYDENGNPETCDVEHVYPALGNSVIHYTYARLSDALAAQSDTPIEDDNKTNEDNENKTTGVAFSDVILLNEWESKDIHSDGDGETYSVQYSTYEIDDEAAGLNLSVSNNTASFSLEDERVYFASIEAAYVADINHTDAYGNFIVILCGEDAEEVTFIFAFNNDEIKEIGSFIGKLVPESIAGDGTAITTYNIGMPVTGYGCFTIQPEFVVTGLSVEEKTVHCGRTKYTGGSGNFEEGVWPTTDKDLTVYKDISRSQISGTIPAGSVVAWECESNNVNIYVKCGDVEGYVSFHELRGASI